MRKLLILAGIAGWHLSTFAHAGNIVETAQEAGKFGPLIAAAQAAGLADALANGKNLTVRKSCKTAYNCNRLHV